MPIKLPIDIPRHYLLNAIATIDNQIPNPFGESTAYDVFHNGKRYAPKAVIGVAASQLLGVKLSAQDFKGGIGTRCFAILIKQGFSIISKGETSPFPNEIESPGKYYEGALLAVRVLKFERDMEAREKCIEHYGATCVVCGIDFSHVYGAIGDGFIHVHHLVPLAQIREGYEVDPVRDLRPVCPNCHAMLHKRTPPFSIEELRTLIY